MRQLFRKLRFFLRRDQFERDLEEEIRYHLDRKAEEQIRPEAVLRQFGRVAQVKEESRRMWTSTLWEQFAQDVRYGIRAMTANPLFTAMAVLSLALGIGANTAIFGFLDGILLRDLPVERPGELVVLNWRASDQPKVIHRHSGSRYRDGKHGIASPNYPYPFYRLLRAKQDALSALFAYANMWELNLVAREQADISAGELVSGNYFHDLGVVPAAGRLIVDDDDRTGAPPVAVLSYGYWRKRYLSDPAAVGEVIRINHVPVTIIGVSAPGFFGVNPAADPSVYLPLLSAPRFAPKPAEDERRRFLEKDSYWVEMMGRLRPGVSLIQAQAELAGRFHQYAVSTVTSPKEKDSLPELWLEPGAGGLDSLRRQYSEPLFVLMAMVTLILAIACANIANLLLARATSRRREMAVRLSLGAGRGRVIRQLLTESLLLSVTGAILGLFVALWGIRSITWLLANGQENFTLRASLSWPVLAFTAALAVATGVLFGLAPALQATRVDLTSGLKESRIGAPGRFQRFSLSQVLVAAQIAISLILVIAAGLFVRTLSNLHSVQLGFNREDVLIFNMNARQAGYKDAALATVYGDLLDRFGRIPGVRSAGLSQAPLAVGFWNSTGLTIPGASKTLGAGLETCIEPVDPSFLATMQIPILAGRGFQQHDMEAPRVAVVTEQFARKFFPNENPLGRRIGLGDSKSAADIEIIGIAKTAHYNSIQEQDTPPVAYVPYTQNLDNLGSVFFELRTAGGPLLTINTVRQIVHQEDSTIAVSGVSTLAAHIDQTIGKEITFAQLCTCFAVLALVIACVGLYGAIAYAVARRTNEIGIRMALGAERWSIQWMVLRELLTLAASGITVGLVIAGSTTRFVASFLFGLKHNDPAVLSVSVLLLAATAVAAAYAPARRAARVDPMAALRHE